jgi:hypothetical protein
MQRLFNGLGRSGQKPGSTAIKVISVARSTVDVRHCHHPNHDCAPYPIFVPSSVMRPLFPGEYCAHPTPRRATHTSHRYFHHRDRHVARPLPSSIPPRPEICAHPAAQPHTSQTGPNALASTGAASCSKIPRENEICTPKKTSSRSVLRYGEELHIDRI